MLSKERFLIDSLQRMYLRASECWLRISAISIRWKESSSAKGLEIDGASFGRAFSILFGDQHDYDIPATPHDQLYADNRVAGQYLTRDQCDKVFYRAMQYAGFSKALAWTFMPASDWVAGGHGGEIVAEMRKSGRRNRYEKDS